MIKYLTGFCVSLFLFIGVAVAPSLIPANRIQQSSAYRFTTDAEKATWNSKQNSLTLTTTGTSGAATLSSGILNIPNYATGGGGGTSVDYSQFRISTLQAVGGNTTISTVGLSFGGLGTPNARGLTQTSNFTRTYRVGYVSATSANSNAGLNIGNSIYLNQNFMYTVVFGVSDPATVSTARAFYGISQSLLSGDPNAMLNCFGVGSDSGDTNLSWYYNDGLGTPTKTDLGGNFPANSLLTDMYRLSIWALAGTVYYSLTNTTNGATSTGNTATNIPGYTIGMTMRLNRNNNTTAASVALDFAWLNFRIDV